MFKKFINLCVILVLVGVAFIVPTSSARAEEPQPVFHIAPDRGYACGAFWTIGESVTLLIEDDGGSEIHQETKDAIPAWWDETGTAGEACFDFEPGLVQPGMTASMYDDFVTKKISIVGLSFDAVDSDGLASGTGPADTSGYLCLNWTSGCNSVTIDSEGNWTGALPGYDPATSDLSDAHIKIGDGDDLVAYLPMEDPPPMPMFTVQPQHGWVGGWGWPVDELITLVVDNDQDPGNGDLFSTTSMSFESEWEEGVGEIFFELWDQPAHLDPGNYVSVSVGTTTKVTQIVPLTFDAVSGTGQASGLGPDSGEGHACLDFADEGYCEPITLASGTWTADFSGYGLNIDDLRDAHVVVFDEDWDETMAHLPPAPSIDFHTSYNWLDVDHFPAYSPVEVEIYTDNPIIETLYTDEGGHIGWDVMTYLPPDTLIRVVYGEDEIVKELVVENLSVDYFDYDGDLAGGAANEGAQVNFVLEGPGIYLEGFVTAGDSGWGIDFGVDYGIDLQEEMYFQIYTEDGDGDRNKAEFMLPPQPWLTVNPGQGWIAGINLPIGVETTLTITDPVLGEIFLEEQTSSEDSWNPGMGFVWFETGLSPEELHDGVVVSLDWGGTPRETIIVPLTFDEVSASGIASGLGPEIGEGHACLDFDFDSFCEPITLDAGDWTADFSHYGLDMDELRDAHVVVWDDDGDETMANLWIPLPLQIDANVTSDWVAAFSFGPEVEYTRLEVYDEGASLPKCEETFYLTGEDVVNLACWDQGVDIRPGDEVLLYVEGEQVKEHIVFDLSLTEADLGSGHFAGLAPEGSTVRMDVYYPADFYSAEVLVEGGDDWEIDFGPLPDDPNVWFEAVIVDNDGDQTLADYVYPLYPFFRVNLTKGLIRALAWPDGDFLTLEIDDPLTPDPVDFSATGYVDDIAPWDAGLTMLEFDIGEFEILPGFLIRIYDTDIVKETIITGLTVTSVDDDANTATGSTDPLSKVEVLAIGAENEFLTVDSGTDGIWTAYFTIDLQGDELFLIMEWDEDGDSTEVRWFPNNPPSALDDAYSMNEDGVLSQLTTGVLVNDSDPDGDDLAMMLVDDVQFGVLEYNTDGTFTYTPEEDYSGSDSFSYKAYDGELESNLALVTITVESVNDVPQVTLPAVFSIDEGQIFLGSGSFTDPDQDTWTGTVDYGDGLGSVPLSLTTQQSFELFYSYLPSGVYPVTVTIHDGFSVGQASSELIVYNVAPAVNIDALAGGESSVLVGLDVSLLGSFIDPGADTHTALIEWGDGAQTVIDPALNPLAANHVYQTPGLYTVTLTVTDDDGGVGMAAATLEVIEPADAAEDVIGELDSILTNPELDPGAAAAVEGALVDLEGANDGLSSSGALDKIVGGQWNAALVKLEKVVQDLEAAEAADPSLDLSDLKELLVLIGKSVVLEIIETEHAAGSPVTVIEQAYALVDEGQVLLDGGDYLGAVAKFLDALHVL